jgi:serine/threonine protein kinase/tetratricopeptide (TPR) repeat protein
MNDYSARAKSIFLDAIERTPEEWPVFLDQACAGDAALRASVEKLLRAQAQMGSFHEDPRPPLFATVDAPAISERPGTVIGPYKLLQQIGEGGMGTVFMAEQTHPVQRKVALKVIKPGMDSRQVIARFEAERQALAMMDHVNIARVFDAGATESGRPYFVMELVHGVPITKYCDDNRLSPRERLELFVPVCQAIQHAHQKGIIHRDVKPSNVMITLYDGKPVPKVIDFGVAKATEQKLTERTLFTQYGAMVGTFEYMSPEQAEMSALGADTRSDIFSLGVLLYELLTGSTPLSHNRVREAAYGEVLRMIREEEAPKPSTRLSDSGEALASISAQRHMEPAKLTKLVRGELDWIVMKCLEKDRNHRYETANGFAMDVQRYLADEAVLACPPSTIYRLKKFVRRNKGPVLAASIILLCLLAGIVGTSAGLVWAVRERDDKAKALIAETKARESEKQARERALTALRALTDDIVQNQMARGTTLTEENKEFLRKIIKHFEGFAAITADDAESRSIREEGYFRVGKMRYHLGELKEAEAAFNESLALLKQLAAEFPDVPEYRHRLAVNHDVLGGLYSDTGRLKEAETAHADALVLLKQLAADIPASPGVRRDLAGCYLNQGNLFRTTGRLEEAETAYDAALSLQKKLVAGSPTSPGFRPDLAATLHSVGNLFSLTGRLEKAEASFNEGLTILRQLVAESPTRPDFQKALAGSLNSLGVLLHHWGRTKDSEDAYTAALAIQKQLAAKYPTIPEFRQELALSHSNLGIVLSDTNRLKEAEAAYIDALVLRKQLADDFPDRPEFHRELAVSHINLGSLFSKTERNDKAETAFTDALNIQKRLAAQYPTKPDIQKELAASHFNLASQYRDTNRLPKALVAFGDALAVYKKLADAFPTRPEYQDLLAATHNNMGILLLRMEKRPEAKAAYLESLSIKEKLTAAFPTVPSYAVYLGGAYCNFGNLVKAEGQLEAALDWFRKAIATLEPVAVMKPPQVNAREFLRNTYYARALTLEVLDRFAESTRDWERVVELHDGPERFPRVKLAESRLRRSHQDKDAAGCLAAAAEYDALKPNNPYGAACSRAMCAAAILLDPKTPPADAARLAKQQADRAMVWLHKAVAAGFKDAECLKKEKDFDALYEREDFKKLLVELQAKKK